MASRAVGPLRPVVVGLAASLIVGAVACTHPDPPPATPSAPPAPLPIITKAEPPPYCQFRGAVSSLVQESNVAYDDVQQQAAIRGATVVVLDGTRASGGGAYGYRIKTELFGRAYWCPPPPGYASPPPPGYASPPPAAPGPAPTAAAPPPPLTPASSTLEVRGECTPACNTGYACVARACVPTCSPACAAGQICSSDRVCRSR